MSPVRRERTSPGEPASDSGDPRGRQAGAGTSRLSYLLSGEGESVITVRTYGFPGFYEATRNLGSQPPQRTDRVEACRPRDVLRGPFYRGASSSNTRTRSPVRGSTRSAPARIPSFCATRSDAALSSRTTHTTRRIPSARQAHATAALAASVARPAPRHAAGAALDGPRAEAVRAPMGQDVVEQPVAAAVQRGEGVAVGVLPRAEDQPPGLEPLRHDRHGPILAHVAQKGYELALTGLARRGYVHPRRGTEP